MIVFKADESNLFDWLPLAVEFYNEGFNEYKWGFVEEDATMTYMLFIQNHLCYMAKVDNEIVGCMAGVITQHHFNYSFNYYQEAMWYVKPEFRGKGVATALLKATEAECERLNCKKIAVGISQSVLPKELDRAYRQMGFKLFETHYIKDIQCQQGD